MAQKVIRDGRFGPDGTWENTLRLKRELEKIQKARAMIFQVDAKEEAARAFRKPFNAFYHMPYARWAKVSRLLVRKRDRVIKKCLELGMPSSMTPSEFPYYREQMGLDRET